MTDEKTLDSLERMVRDAEHGVHSFIVYQQTLLDLIADSRKLAAVRAWHVENWDGIGPMPEPLQIIDGD